MKHTDTLNGIFNQLKLKTRSIKRLEISSHILTYQLYNAYLPIGTFYQYKYDLQYFSRLETFIKYFNFKYLYILLFGKDRN